MPPKTHDDLGPYCIGLFKSKAGSKFDAGNKRYIKETKYNDTMVSRLDATQTSPGAIPNSKIQQS